MTLRNRALVTLLFAAVLYGCTRYLTGCTTAQRDAAGKAVIATGQKMTLDAFNAWLEEQ